MIGLTNKYVELVGKRLIKNFIGCFPCDIQPNVSKLKTFAVVFNESKHDEAGSHFVCVYASESRIFYFDSMGLALENDHIKLFVYSCQRPVTLIARQIQSFESNFCGFFCLCFLLYMSKNLPPDNFFKCFSSELKLNDKIVLDFIKKMVK